MLAPVSTSASMADANSAIEPVTSHPASLTMTRRAATVSVVLRRDRLDSTRAAVLRVAGIDLCVRRRSRSPLACHRGCLAGTAIRQSLQIMRRRATRGRSRTKRPLARGPTPSSGRGDAGRRRPGVACVARPIAVKAVLTSSRSRLAADSRPMFARARPAAPARLATECGPRNFARPARANFSEPLTKGLTRRKPRICSARFRQVVELDVPGDASGTQRL